MYQFVIPLSGLNCMGCARKVEKALHANHDVEILTLSPNASRGQNRVLSQRACLIN